MHAAFEAVSGAADQFVATPWAAGPWNPGLCHGGAPAALALRCAERLSAPDGMQIARMTLELMRPVPVGRLTTGAEVVREGRKLQIVDVVIRAAGQDLVRARVLKLRAEPMARAQQESQGDEAAGASFRAIAPPLDCPLLNTRNSSGFTGLFETRSAQGGFLAVGPGSVWFRLSGELIAGETSTPAMRAAAVADFANGVSGALPFDRWTYINLDLTLSLTEEPRGDWLLLDAETTIGPAGRGASSARLADERGWVGRAAQTLLIEPRS